MKKTLKIDTGIVTELQRLSVEVEARKELIAFMITQNMDTDSEKFKEYEHDYQKFFFSYQQAKTSLEKNILRPVFGEENMIRWTLDFATEEAEVELKD